MVGLNPGMPDRASLAALRAWHEGLPARAAVMRYLKHTKADAQSSRGMIGAIRREIAAWAQRCHRHDLIALFEAPAKERVANAPAVARAIEDLLAARPAQPAFDDDIAMWLTPRTAAALKKHGIDTLARLAVRVPRRRRWWAQIPGLGSAGAKGVEAFFAAHPMLAEPARRLIESSAPAELAPWELLELPQQLDGSQGAFRAEMSSSTLSASNDHEAVTAWLGLHESAATQRAYRKEAERLILWAIVERGKPMSSLTVEDATAYRAFLRRPTPASRWVGPSRPRFSSEWRPFSGGLSARSAAHALTVLNAMYRWLIQQRYVVANPFAGVKVRGSARADPIDCSRAFSEGEWRLIRTVADGLEWSYGWSTPAAQRLRFLIDFSYASGLRASELVGATLGDIEIDAVGDRWLRVIGKGAKAGKVSMPPMATASLDRYLAQRGLPVTPSRWLPSTPVIGRLSDDGERAITAARLWSVVRRFFRTVATVIADQNPALSDKLQRASTHWMRHTHATHALQLGADLTTVRDNLRHASISTTSTYLHGDDAKRSSQLRAAFAASQK